MSYLEWKQNKASEHWSEEQVNRELDDILTVAMGDAIKRANREDCSLKEAAVMIALERLS